jgi:hypothetical protein
MLPYAHRHGLSAGKDPLFCLRQLADLAQQLVDLAHLRDRLLCPAPVLVVSIPRARRPTIARTKHPTDGIASHRWRGQSVAARERRS